MTVMDSPTKIVIDSEEESDSDGMNCTLILP